MTRVVAVLMAGVLCFALIVPMALQRHSLVIAVVVSALYLAYVAANVVLWLRLRSRT
ncbi:MAG TPA: hypothetical protein VMF61_10935 [Candidatus Acidoferrales bacterium]|nr:hypothetical protein [Candidatus Acidoferrales bacterium]